MGGGLPYEPNNFDLLKRDNILEWLEQCEWDLVVVDEAHKMSASFSGGVVRTTARYKLGQMICAPDRTRHVLLLTATPHNGKEEEFQLFFALLNRRVKDEEQKPRAARDLAIDMTGGLDVRDEDDIDELPDAEVEGYEEQVVDQASNALTIEELKKEIDRLKDLEALAKRVRESGTDRKLTELRSLLQSRAEMFNPQGRRRKLMIFTEHRDTLSGAMTVAAGRTGSSTTRRSKFS